MADSNLSLARACRATAHPARSAKPDLRAPRMDPTSAHRAHALARTALNLAAALVLALCSGLDAWAQLPATQLFAIAPVGGRQGTTLDLTLSGGADLDGVNSLYFSHPGITAQPKMAPLAPFQTVADLVPNQFTVTIAADVPPGVYDICAVGTFGISNPRSFVVGDLPEVIEQPGNNSQDKALVVPLGSVVNGLSDGVSPDWFKVTLAPGQRLIVDCWAQRLDSRMDATLVLYDLTGRELIQSRDVHRRDPLLDFTADKGGDYLIKLYDFVYAGGAEYFYRLTVGVVPYLDFMVPACGMPGTANDYTLYGRNLPGGVPADGLMVDGRPLEKLVVRIEIPAGVEATRTNNSGLVRPEESVLDGMDYRLVTPQGTSNPLFLSYAAAPVIVEQEPNNEPAQAQVLTVPCEFSGQFNARGDQDYLQFEGKQGDVFWVEVVSQRLGLPTDPTVLISRVVKNDKGEEQVSDLASIEDDAKNIGGFNFNTVCDESAYRFAIPENGVYRLLVRDSYNESHGSPRFVYRLAIRREQPDFRLVALTPYPGNVRTEAKPWGTVLRRGGNLMVDVFVFRRDGFAGEVRVSVEGLPEGVTCAPAIIGPGLDTTTLILNATEQAPAWKGTFRIVGKATVASQELTREARSGSVLFAAAANLPALGRLIRGNYLAVSGTETESFLVEVGPGQTWSMSRAGNLEIPVKVTRRGEIKAAITLTPVGLPPNVAPQPLALDANTNEGKLILQIPPSVALGDFTFFVQAQTTIGYKRDQAAADAALAVKTELEKVVTDLTAISQEADKAKVAADQAVVDATNAQKAASDAKVLADAEAQKAAEAFQAAAAAAAAAKEAADKDANNQDLAKASQDAQQAATDAETKNKTAAEAQVTATNALADADAKLKAATEGQTSATTVAAEAAAKLKAATDAKTAAETKATNLANAAAPKDLNVFLASTIVAARVEPSPITLTITAPAAQKPGTQVELPIVVNRLFGYADAVNLELVPPPGVAGLKAAAVVVAAGVNDGKLLLELGADATPGTHTVTVRGTATFNGQALQSDQTFTLTIEPAQQGQ